MLREYVGLRIGIQELKGEGISEQVVELVKRSEQFHQQLWTLAVNNAVGAEKSAAAEREDNPFMASVLALTDIHYTRVHSAIMNRIPVTIWMTLYLMAALSMIIMGYQAGLTDRRSPVATITLAFAFSAVIILITDLDRPIMSFFEINNQLLVDLYEHMNADIQDRLH